MKKDYIEPRITVITCSSERIMMQNVSTSTGNLNGGNTKGPGVGLQQEEAGSKSNSGLLDWDDEEE